MSTNNFKYDNVLITCPEFCFKHDCVLSECEETCEREGEYEEFDQFAYDEYVSDIQSQLSKIGFESCNKWESGRDGGKIIASWGQEDDCFVKYLEVVIRSGYYDGMNIDYTIDGDFCPNEESKAECRHVNALQKKFDKQVVRLEKILRKNGQELIKVAQFSNGEAVYQLKK